tara:strand:+ start:393 stop:725 length:333 start_codon:yes stop_codon:yes gene_type:complete
MKQYANKWIIQRITAIILIPLTFWFIYSCISFSKMNYYQITIFFNSIINVILFLSMMISMLIHSKIGCDTIVEDYVSSNNSKKIIKLILSTIVYVLGLLILFSVLKVYLN